MVTGIFRKVNDSMFCAVDNMMLTLEFICPIVLSALTHNWCYLFLIITPYLSAYAFLMVAIVSGISEEEAGQKIETLCRLSDISHVLVVSFMIVIVSGTGSLHVWRM